MFSEMRQCPTCEHGQVVIAELSKGTQCTYWRRFIEIDFVFGAGIPILFALLLTLAFSNEFKFIGFGFTLLTVLYTAIFESVVARYIPLKHYGDGD
jgi:hypothetical protein